MEFSEFRYLYGVIFGDGLFAAAFCYGVLELGGRGRDDSISILMREKKKLSFSNKNIVVSINAQRRAIISLATKSLEI